MGWLEETTARWLRVMAAAGYGSTALDEGVRLISGIGDPDAARTGRFRRPKQNVTEAAAVTVTALSRHLITGVLASDLLISRLCAATGRTREEVLAELAGGLSQWLQDEQLRVLRLELSASCVQLQGPGHAAFASLGSRIEQLLKLADLQATEVLQEARAEAAKITSPADGRPPCPRCGATWPDAG
jgi:hypothetical protein